MFIVSVSTTRHSKKLIEDVRSLKNTGVVMESDERAQKMIALLQSNLKDLFKMRFAVRSDVHRNKSSLHRTVQWDSVS